MSSSPSSMGSAGMGSQRALPATRCRPQSEQLQQRQQPQLFQQHQPLQNVCTARTARSLSLAAHLPCKCGPKPKIDSANALHQCCMAAAHYEDSYLIGTNAGQYEWDEISFQIRKLPEDQIQNLNLPESRLAQVEDPPLQSAAGCHYRHCGPSAAKQTQADKALLNNFEEVEQLILEESDDIQIALCLQNRYIASSQNAEGVCQAEQSGFHSQKRKSSCQHDEFQESDDEVSPEVAAAMMHSEEQGILMGAAPSRVFNALFTDDEKDIIAVTSAAPFHPQCVVIPACVDNMPYTSSAEDLVALTSMRENESPPCSSIFSDALKQRGLYSSVLEEASRPYVTEPNETIGSSEDTSRTSFPCGGTIEYVLDPASPPDHYSRIQLRGSTSPEWFPGFFQALPSIDGITAVCRDPGSVLEDAWWTLQSTMA